MRKRPRITRLAVLLLGGAGAAALALPSVVAGPDGLAGHSWSGTIVAGHSWSGAVPTGHDWGDTAPTGRG